MVGNPPIGVVHVDVHFTIAYKGEGGKRGEHGEGERRACMRA